MHSIDCLAISNNLIGENPVWNVAEQSLYWIDTRTPIMRRFQPATGKLEQWEVPPPLNTTDQIVSFAFRRSGGMLAAFRRGFYGLDIQSGRAVKIVDAESVPEVPESNRMNDAKCDARGRFWCGSMDTNYVAPTGSLYRLGSDLKCTRMDSGIICSNGIAFSPDNKTLYYADTRGFIVWAYDFDLEDGAISNRREFISTRHMAGRPDGATVDTDGNYWVAMIAMGAIAKFNPEGKLLRLIEMPVTHPTMCIFGGRNMDVLFVTSASFSLTPEQKLKQPLAGALFAITGTGSQGVPEPMFAG